jgi:ATP-dependent Lhr-like helicase
MPPSGLPGAFLEPVPAALRGLLARYARTHGPFLTDEAAARLGAEAALAASLLGDLEEAGALVRGELRPGGSGREWCDADVLRRLRRASLAALRREIEPAEPQALGRFLPAWQRVDRPPDGPGPDRLREAIAPLQGLALPAAQWEGEVFPRRLGSYSPAWLDQLAAAGEIVWVGAGAMARDGGRVVPYLREDAALFGPPPAGPPPEGEEAEALRAALARGAAFWEDLDDAVPGAAEDAFAALWSLVWAGEVTNDLWSPLRGPRALPRLRPAPRRFGPRRPGRPRSARSPLAGRWSLTGPLFARAPSPGERRRALAELLLERHGVLTRAAVLADGVPGGFGAVYSELVDLETLGLCRRGYFVEGLGGAQFALPGAVERLRDGRDAPSGEPPEVMVIGAADPAQPYGAAVPWPRRGEGRAPSRTHGAQVVLVDGEAVLYLERGGRGLLSLRDQGPGPLGAALAALAAWVRADRRRRVAIERVDGAPVFGSPLEPALRELGFQEGLRALTLRA